MSIKRSNSEQVFEVCNVLFMLCMIFVTLYPVWHVVMTSLSDTNEIMRHRGLIFYPRGFTFDAYKEVLDNPMIWRGYVNTIIVVVAGCTINVILTSIGAYFLSRKNVMLKSIVMFMVVFTMFFSGGMIPVYLTVRSLKLTDTLWALMLPNAISTFNLIIMRTAFQSVPDSLEESAKLDGARHMTILFRIVLPLSLPTVAVIVLYYGVGHWNSWFNAMIYLKTRTLFPLQLLLREMLIENTVADNYSQVMDKPLLSETFKNAVIVVATVPILCVYPFLQKYFVKGVMVGSIKG